MMIKEKIEKLRQLMKENKIDAYVIPSFDAHQSEYVAYHWKSREWVSGFTGSAGTVVITLHDAGLWTDGRYYIQAEKQLQDSGIRLFRMADVGTPSYTDWLNDVLNEGSSVGFDGSVFSVDMVNSLKMAFKSKKIAIKMDKDLIDLLWHDRPAIPTNAMFVHDVKYAGISRTEKFNIIRKEMNKKGANYYLLTSLDDIAWLLNIRGSDVPNNPVVICNVILSLDKCYLFIDSSKVPNSVRLELQSDKVEFKSYTDVQQFLKSMASSDKIMFDPNMTNALLYNSININVTKLQISNITLNLKAVKNKTEIANLKCCELSDGVAMVKFIKWLKTSINEEHITELSASDKLQQLRKKDELCVGLSFDTIAGYKEHAAMMHYIPKIETTSTLENRGLFLVDSGGQYFNGTTDITRTIVLGNLTEEEKSDFTLVLKSHIALATAKFLYGATGSNLDVIARQPIWKYGLDYKCGTGHGVGFFLNVHEGPQRLSQVPNDIKIEEGMILTNEPGIYKEGKHGVRTENMMIVVNDEKTEFGQFMKFETITYCPIDLDGINKNMLTESELEWLYTYNKNVFTKLSPYLNHEERSWLNAEIMGDN
ncbi:aminopeptidase P family protein [Clostridium akagii]|uniref:aminopeptidase P family protein n=1 Tax=Clostridium akagii TaxID=91623 RepID=UPI0004796FBE|nr:aminopeptidase P family protein [Clostridium akagii]